MNHENQTLFIHNPLYSNSDKFVDELMELPIFAQNSWNCEADEIHSHENQLSKTQLAVIAGGDGTILRSVNSLVPYEIGIVGINMGRIGFMSELDVSDAKARLPNYVNGDFIVQERMMLKASIVSENSQKVVPDFHVLNEVVVGRSKVTNLLDINAKVDGVSLPNYRADALIVSTPTGSTGYGLSAGGPIVYPASEVILLQPVAAHTGLKTGLVLPPHSVVDISLSDVENVLVSADGLSTRTLDSYDLVRVSRSQYIAKFLRSNPDGDFYSSVGNRLGLQTM